MKKRMFRLAGNAQVGVLVVAVSCSAPSPERGHTVELGSDRPTPSSNRPFESVAQAATPPRDAAQDVCKDAGAVMPPNPSHISLRLPKVPKVLVTKLMDEENGGQTGQSEYPYPFEVTETDTETIVTLYIPQGVPRSVVITPKDENGKPLAPPVQVLIDPQAKIGTGALVLDGTAGNQMFPSQDEIPLRMGDTYLQGPATQQFIDGELHEVFRGVYTAEEDCVREVLVAGCGGIVSFVDSYPQRQNSLFSVSMKAGGKLAVVAFVDDNVEAVRVRLSEPTCAPSE